MALRVATSVLGSGELGLAGDWLALGLGPGQEALHGLHVRPLGRHLELAILAAHVLEVDGE